MAQGGQVMFHVIGLFFSLCGIILLASIIDDLIKIAFSTKIPLWVTVAILVYIVYRIICNKKGL